MLENQSLPFETKLKIMKYLEKIELLMKKVKKELQKTLQEEK